MKAWLRIKITKQMNRGSETHVMDNRGCNIGFMVAWFHLATGGWWADTHSFGDCGHCGSNAVG
jgi:hypothetical protein